MSRLDMSSRMKVVADRPARWLTGVLVSVLAAVIVGVVGYALGRYQADRPIGWPGRSDVADVRERALELERKLADVQLSQVVDRDVQERLRQTIKSLRDELSAAQEEVLFYRQLMAPSKAQRGLRIEKFELTPGASATEIRYRLLLTQVVERHDWVGGTVTVEIAGRWDNEQVVLPLTEMTKVETYPLQFRFRYLQDFSGNLVIPDGLTPERVIVTASPAGKGSKQVQKTFSWMLAEE